MLQELIVLSLASAIGWEIIRYFCPWNIPVRLAPLIVIGISYLFTFSFSSSIVMAFAAGGGVALFHKFTDAVTPDVIDLSFFKRSRNERRS